MALLKDVMCALGDLYPWDLAEDDASGLLVGSPDSEVTSVLCSIEPTSDVLEKAIEGGHDLLVVHHQQLLSAGRGVGTGGAAVGIDSSTPGGALAAWALEGGLSIVSCHECADAAPGGTADLWAGHLGLESTRPIKAAAGASIMKIVVFVPAGSLDEVQAAMAEAGAGTIGDYSSCGFRTAGTGTFIPGAGSSPHTGEVGKFNLSEEVRLEMVAPSFAVGRVVEAISKKHPYEEVALDVYRTENPVPWGFGRIGVLSRERSLADITADLQEWCSSTETVLMGDPEKRVTRVAVAPGAADALVEPAWRAGAELLAAGELSWHKTVEVCEAGMALVTPGHLAGDRPLVRSTSERLVVAAAGRGLEIEVQGFRDKNGLWG